MDTAFKATGGVMEKMIVLMDPMSKDAVSIDLWFCQVKGEYFVYIILIPPEKNESNLLYLACCY